MHVQSHVFISSISGSSANNLSLIFVLKKCFLQYSSKHIMVQLMKFSESFIQFSVYHIFVHQNAQQNISFQAIWHTEHLSYIHIWSIDANMNKNNSKNHQLTAIEKEKIIMPEYFNSQWSFYHRHFENDGCFVFWDPLDLAMCRTRKITASMNSVEYSSSTVVEFLKPQIVLYPSKMYFSLPILFSSFFVLPALHSTKWSKWIHIL